MKNAPLIDQWFWEVKYHDAKFLIATNCFHINSMTDKKIEIIKDWHLLIPEELIISKTPDDLVRARDNCLEGKVYFEMLDGKIYLNDRTD